MNRLSFAALALVSCSTDTFVAPDSGTDAASDSGSADGDGGCPIASACPANEICMAFDATSSFSPFVDASKYGGKVDFASDQFVTCPHSMIATVGSVTATNTPIAAIGALIPITSASTATAHLEADVLLPSAPPGGAGYLTLAANASNESVVGLAYTQNGWILWVQASTNSVPIVPRVGAWNHIALDVVYSASGNAGKATLSFTDHDGNPKTAQVNDATLPGGTNVITSVAAGVGIEPSAATSTGVTAYYDDIAFGAQ